MPTVRSAVAIFALVLCAGLLALAGPGNTPAPGHSQSGGPTAVKSENHGIDPTNLDTTCKPCEDFYKFVNGGWMKNNPIPAAYPSWGRFSELAERNRDILHVILEGAAKNRSAAAGSVDQKIGDFYGSCMDEEKVEAEGSKPLGPELDRIAKIHDLATLQAETARLQKLGAGVMFRFGSGQDFKDSTQVIGQARQSGLGLPDRDYYTKTDDKSKEIRDAYTKHVAKMFALMGDPMETAAAEAQTVLAIETKLAEASMTRVERRDPDATYHKMDAAQLEGLTPQFSWTAYFREIGYPNITTVNVGQPDFFKALNAQLTATPLADWKTYLRWHLIHHAAPDLSSKFVEENFDFFGRTLTGAKEILPRWKRCVQATDRALGEALGQKYVAKAFPSEAKARALVMVHNLIAALRDDLNTLPWMGLETKKQATAKLDKLIIKIGYPDKWRDYSAYKVNRGPYVLNVLRGTEFEFNRNMAQIGKPVDRTEWGMSPPTVNAYYNPTINEIVFPAGILQPPFFSADYDDALNYGGMGAVIGHELTHGFDDQGRKFDADGNRREWWTRQDLENFQERAQCVEKQFDSYVVEGDLHQNGKLVLGESIADLGGMTIAHAALLKAMKGKQEKNLDGFTPDERFYIAWARIWGQNNRPQFERLMVNLNPHPLGRFRANGPLSNTPDFAKAFSCKAGDPMVRPDNIRCQIW